MTTNNNNNELVISYVTIRKAIGWLGMLLPFMLVLGNYAINNLHLLNNYLFIDKDCYEVYVPDNSFKSSISHYYYTTVGPLFTGVLIAVALFMFSYKGHVKRDGEFGLSDTALTNLAGLFALGVVVFPTSADSCITDNIHIFISSQTVGNIHYAMAAAFFISLSFMSIVNFRRTEDRISFGKNPEHVLFLVCGIGMLSCLVLIFIYRIWLSKSFPELYKLHPVFLLEALALIFFGVSWLKKGKVDFLYIFKKIRSK